MLNTEQKEAFEKGFALYQKTCAEWENPLCDARLDLLDEAFCTLAEFIDEVDDIYYKVAFANIIQDMQDTDKFDLSDECQNTKINIYVETFKWVQTAEDFLVKYKPFLWSVFKNLAKIFLIGNELEQNDTLARTCWGINKALGHPMADVILSSFIQDNNGDWKYTGDRKKL